LRHVGAGHLADVEAVAGLLERLFQHADVAALDLDDGGVAQIVHVDGGGREQHALFEHAQSSRAAETGFPRRGAVGVSGRYKASASR